MIDHNEIARESLLACAREIGETLKRAYMPEVIEAQRRNDSARLARLHRQFNEDYRAGTARIVSALVALPPPPFIIPKGHINDPL